ncbi:tyrosine isonitrile desaturase/decarboxylase [Xenorhabdus szentirmaii]|uniref:Pyoverdine biosynthesis protein n=1 Tax=Xenorhabdus szentirmaii DSM 16338 TaxID=1427518 RepID=W1J1L3_9GAMM|nr:MULTISPECIES: TauD/TfdA family dioxygenase [Xenorhabdus]MBD2822194.1 TauD/TfdA family dioxygenase [Xenorhabdus sp. 42]PHM30827.1 paerucumarin biosynthesis protein PvcB [Xenorhabdus szentirmaii DSM 16338]CDL83933.1 Pyoverdine biosynthesis protein [Xenorhabdus szentirmaii DSM 16338]
MNTYELDCHIELMKPFGLLLTPNHPDQDISTLSVDRLRELAREYLLVVLRGFRSGFTDKEKLTEYSAQWGEIMMWPFGAVLDVMEHAEPSDHVLDSGNLPLHWDGMYRETIPEFQIFHCVSAPSSAQGGRTSFTNTEKLIADASDDERERWENTTITYRTSKVTHYGGEVISPLLCLHPDGKKWVMRYNEPMDQEDGKYADHHSVVMHGLSPDEQKAREKALRERLYDPRYYYAHQWQIGDIAICDNFTLLHGREAFISHSPRHIQRVHIHGKPVCENICFRNIAVSPV